MNYDEKLQLAAKCLPAAVAFWDGESSADLARFLGIELSDFNPPKHWPMAISKTAFDISEAMISESKLRNP